MAKNANKNTNFFKNLQENYNKNTWIIIRQCKSIIFNLEKKKSKKLFGYKDECILPNHILNNTKINYCV